MSLEIVANRGPLNFRWENGSLVSRRGGGGLVSGLMSALKGTESSWISSAVSKAELMAIENGAWSIPGIELRPVVVDEQIYDSAYNKISNEMLWFAFHDLFDSARSPVFDRMFRHHLEGYRSYNQLFARAIADMSEKGASVVINDYHLLLTPGSVRELRPDLMSSFFLHTPFPPPAEFMVLPEGFQREILMSLGKVDQLGFHCSTWAENFHATSEALGITNDVKTLVIPLASDIEALRKDASADAVSREMEAIRSKFADQKLLVRVDRMELSKNIVRGFLAVEEMMEEHPDAIGSFVHLALCYPSREDVYSYKVYAREVFAAADRINQRYSTKNWRPIVLTSEDNYQRSLAVLQLFDTLLVNPVRDGLNLVAQEGALLNLGEGDVILSKTAGLYEHVKDWVTAINPFDVSETAEAIYQSLFGHGSSKKRHTLRQSLAQNTPGRWLKAVTS